MKESEIILQDPHQAEYQDVKLREHTVSIFPIYCHLLPRAFKSWEAVIQAPLLK